MILNGLNPVHTTYGDVVIEHVDFCGSVHAHCIAVWRQMQHAAATQLCSLTTTISI